MVSNDDVYIDRIFFDKFDKVKCAIALFDGGHKVGIAYVRPDGQRVAVMFDVPKEIIKKIGKDFGYKC